MSTNNNGFAVLNDHPCFRGIFIFLFYVVVLEGSLFLSYFFSCFYLLVIPAMLT